MINAKEIWPPVGPESATGYLAICPNHNDPNGSLHVLQEPDGFIALHCFACGKGAVADIVQASGLTWRDVMGARWQDSPDEIASRREQRKIDKAARVARAVAAGRARQQTAKPKLPPSGCTLAQYAESKRLDRAALKEWGLRDTTWQGKGVEQPIPAVEIPYYRDFGEPVCKRYRIGLTGDRFRHQMGDDTILYGLWRLWSVKPTKPIILVEGESDCHVLWRRGFHAIGVPGASSWVEERDAKELAKYSTIVVATEPDRGGETLINALRNSCIAGRVHPMRFNADAKDPGALWLQSTPRDFDKTIRTMIIVALYGQTIK